MTLSHEDRALVLPGDCLAVLAALPDATVDAVVTDPPYALGFMGKAWDTHTPEGFERWCEAWARECLRILKPGGHLLAFGGTRTYHRLTAGIEDAGFEIRDSTHWIYGSGFPKSRDVAKDIDRRGGADIGWFGPWLREERRRRGISSNELARHFPSRTGGETGCVRNWELSLNLPTPEQFNTLCRVLGLPFAEIAEAERKATGVHAAGLATGTSGVGAAGDGGVRYDLPATPEARRWHGWGTALKPAHEPIVVARKPLTGTVAANVLQHGTGALNIDACRVEHTSAADLATSKAKNPGRGDTVTSGVYGAGRPQQSVNEEGRWPANVVLDEDAAAELDEQSGTLKSGGGDRGITSRNGLMGDDSDRGRQTRYARDADAGGASRFFPVFRYQAKAPTKERPSYVTEDGRKIAHPTCKPVALMRWLVKLVTPPDGLVLDPFAGSGTTVEAALLEGFRALAIEREAEYFPLIQQRIDRVPTKKAS